MKIQSEYAGLFLDIEVSDEGEVFLLNLGSRKLPPPEEKSWYRLIEVQMAGFNQDHHHGNKKAGTQPGSLFRYRDHRIYDNAYGRKVEIRKTYETLEVITHLQFFKEIVAVES